MTPEHRFERIEAILHGMAERENQMEIRSAQDHERAMKRIEAAEKRMDRYEQAAERRAKAVEVRMNKFERQLQATRRLVEYGMRLVVRNGAAIRDLAKTQKAFLDSLRGHNGNGHPRNS